MKAIGLKLMHMYVMVMICNMPSYSIFGENDSILKFWKYDTFWPLTPLGGVVWQGHHWLF